MKLLKAFIELLRVWPPRYIELGGQVDPATGLPYRALVDKDTHAALSRHHWTALVKGRRVVAVRLAKNYLTGKWQLVYMHRLIAGTPPDLTCDHFNGYALDNRRCNLENVTDQENNRRKNARRRGEHWLAA